MDELNSRMARTEERLSELDDRTIKSPNLSRQKQTGTVKKERKEGKGKEKIKQKPSGSRILRLQQKI